MLQSNQRYAGLTDGNYCHSPYFDPKNNSYRPCWVLGQFEVALVCVLDGPEQPGVEAHGLQHPGGQPPLDPPGLRGVLQHTHNQTQVVAGLLGLKADAGGGGDAVLPGLEDHQLTGQQGRADIDRGELPQGLCDVLN